MAYRRRQQVGRVDAPVAYNYDSVSPQGPPAEVSLDVYSSSPASSLAAKAIRASSAHRDSSLSSLYEQSALFSSHGYSTSSGKDSSMDERSPKKNIHESKQGFWGVLARKAKSILDDDGNMDKSHERPGLLNLQSVDGNKKDQHERTHATPEVRKKTDDPPFRKGFDKITSSLNYIGSALEEGITAVENRTADIIQETCKFQIRKKSGISTAQNQASHISIARKPWMQTHIQPQVHTDLETQLKASRDVAMAMAAKAKLLLRELKTVKADFAFAKERCAQLEEENRILRESREKGDNPEDDDLIRLQLESLLAEKARLAQENSVYARENRFLREIVVYHQLTMQDVIYLDEGSEEVSEVTPIRVTSPDDMQSFVAMPAFSPTPTIPPGATMSVPLHTASACVASQEAADGVKKH